MSIEQLKQEAKALAPIEQDELAAFLSVLREERDDAFNADLQRRMDDKNPEHWVRIEDVKARLARGE